MNYNQGYPVVKTMDMQNQETRMWLEVQKDLAKAQNRAQLQIEVSERKQLLKEREQERRKAKYEEIQVGDDGTVSILTQNLQITASPRHLANFLYPEVTKVHRIRYPEDQLFLFHCKIGNDIKYVMLDPECCGSATYVLRKMTSVGGDIKASTLAEKKRYALQLLGNLVRKSNTMWVPEGRGWYKNENGQVSFYQGKWTWEEARICAK